MELIYENKNIRQKFYWNNQMMLECESPYEETDKFYFQIVDVQGFFDLMNG